MLVSKGFHSADRLVFHPCTGCNLWQLAVSCATMSYIQALAVACNHAVVLSVWLKASHERNVLNATQTDNMTWVPQKILTALSELQWWRIPAERSVSMLSSHCSQAAPKIVVWSAGTSSGTHDIQAGLVLVLTLPYSSGPSGFEASMNCRSKHTRVVSKSYLRCATCVCCTSHACNLVQFAPWFLFKQMSLLSREQCNLWVWTAKAWVGAQRNGTGHTVLAWCKSLFQGRQQMTQKQETGVWWEQIAEAKQPPM